MAAAGGLFHNLGSFASVRSSRMHASQRGSSEFLAISNTEHFGPSGGRFERFDVVLLSIPSHSATVQGGGVYGETHRPHSCCAKARTQI
jgi:hypothetical protein